MPGGLLRRPGWTGAVLTGGASSRMGRDKALVAVGGTPLARLVADALTAAGADRVFAVGGNKPGLEALDLEVVTDDHPGEGPLGGLLTAFAASRTDVVVALACDLPAADAGSVRTVLDALTAHPRAAVAWPQAGGHRHVLHAAWRLRWAQVVLQGAFASGERAPRRAAAGLEAVVVTTVAEASLRNVNRPEDLAPG